MSQNIFLQLFSLKLGGDCIAYVIVAWAPFHLKLWDRFRSLQPCLQYFEGVHVTFNITIYKFSISFKLHAFKTLLK